jgi:putative transcriptional regulator
MEFSMETTGQRLIQSLQEALEYAQAGRGNVKVSKVERFKTIATPNTLDVKEIREHLQMSQAEFAARFGMNLSTLKNWEHGRRVPDMATRTYFYAISRNPELVEKALYS